MSHVNWGTVGAVTLAMCAVLTLIGGLVGLIWRRGLKLLLFGGVSFLRDWHGEPGRPGVKARPGVMERLADQDHAIAEIRAETQPNGGSSMRDLAHQTAADVAGLKDSVAGLTDSVAGLLEWQATIEQQTTTQVTSIEVRPAPPSAGRGGTVARRRT